MTSVSASGAPTTDASTAIGSSGIRLVAGSQEIVV